MRLRRPAGLDEPDTDSQEANVLLDPWDVRSENFPRMAGLPSQLSFLLNYAVLAPSGHNTQPWLFRVHDRCVDLLADRRRRLPVVDPHDRELVISCGAALGNLMIAMRRFGIAAEVRRLPNRSDPDVLAVVHASGTTIPSQTDTVLCDALARRRTTRTAYRPEPLPEPLMQQASRLCEQHGVELAFVRPHQRSAVGELVAEGDRTQLANAGFRRELAHWVHSRRRSSKDGLSFEAFGGPDVLSFAGAAVIRTFDLGKQQAVRSRELVLRSPALAVLATPADNPSDWLACGEALAGMLAALTAAGFTNAYLNQPIEVDRLRAPLCGAVGLRGFAQLLLRIGRSPEVAPAARRPVIEVLVGARSGASSWSDQHA